MLDVDVEDIEFTGDFSMVHYFEDGKNVNIVDEDVEYMEGIEERK